MAIKQVIVIRRDLKMRRGKEISQGCHASMKFLCDRIRVAGRFSPSPISFTDAEWEWLNGLFTKVCLQVSSEAELLDVHRRAQETGLVSCLIQDAGKTEFGGIPTYTCCAIGPDTAEKIDPITSTLALY